MTGSTWSIFSPFLNFGSSFLIQFQYELVLNSFFFDYDFLYYSRPFTFKLLVSPLTLHPLALEISRLTLLDRFAIFEMILEVENFFWDGYLAGFNWFESAAAFPWTIENIFFSDITVPGCKRCHRWHAHLYRYTWLNVFNKGYLFDFVKLLRVNLPKRGIESYPPADAPVYVEQVLLDLWEDFWDYSLPVTYVFHDSDIYRIYLGYLVAVGAIIPLNWFSVFINYHIVVQILFLFFSLILCILFFTRIFVPFLINTVLFYWIQFFKLCWKFFVNVILNWLQRFLNTWYIDFLTLAIFRTRREIAFRMYGKYVYWKYLFFDQDPDNTQAITLIARIRFNSQAYVYRMHNLFACVFMRTWFFLFYAVFLLPCVVLLRYFIKLIPSVLLTWYYLLFFIIYLFFINLRIFIVDIIYFMIWTLVIKVLNEALIWLYVGWNYALVRSFVNWYKKVPHYYSPETFLTYPLRHHPSLLAFFRKFIPINLIYYVIPTTFWALTFIITSFVNISFVGFRRIFQYLLPFTSIFMTFFGALYHVMSKISLYCSMYKFYILKFVVLGLVFLFFNFFKSYLILCLVVLILYFCLNFLVSMTLSIVSQSASFFLIAVGLLNYILFRAFVFIVINCFRIFMLCFFNFRYPYLFFVLVLIFFCHVSDLFILIFLYHVLIDSCLEDFMLTLTWWCSLFWDDMWAWFYLPIHFNKAAAQLNMEPLIIWRNWLERDLFYYTEFFFTMTGKFKVLLFFKQLWAHTNITLYYFFVAMPKAYFRYKVFLLYFNWFSDFKSIFYNTSCYSMWYVYLAVNIVKRCYFFFYIYLGYVWKYFMPLFVWSKFSLFIYFLVGICFWIKFSMFKWIVWVPCSLEVIFIKFFNVVSLFVLQDFVFSLENDLDNWFLIHFNLFSSERIINILLKQWENIYYSQFWWLQLDTPLYYSIMTVWFRVLSFFTLWVSDRVDFFFAYLRFPTFKVHWFLKEDGIRASRS